MSLPARRFPQLRRGFLVLCAMAVGLAPGALVPFIAAATLAPSASDELLLAMSVSVFLINALALSVEADCIGCYGRGEYGPAGWTATGLRLALRRSLRQASLFGVPAVPLLVMAIGIGAGRRDAEFLVAGFVMGATALVAAGAAGASGLLIASGRPAIPVATQGFRAAFLIGALVALPSASPVAWSVAYLVGEALRGLALWCAAHARTVPGVAMTTVVAGGQTSVGAQVTSVAMSQLNPVIDRTLLTPMAAGSVTAYEVADKIAFGVYQAVYNLVILRRVGQWSRSLGADGHGARSLVRRDVVLIGGAAAMASLLTSLVVWGTLETSAAPQEWDQGLRWSLLVLWSMPGSLVIASMFRLYAIVRASRRLLAYVPLWVVVNALGDVALIALMGPVGVAVASVLSKSLIAIVLVVDFLRLVPRVPPSVGTAQV